MPKSSKKNKDKTADFAKAKLKLGKGKKIANNATDISFKARSISIPHQTIGLEKDASNPVTRRNLSVDDLLVHLKHYNPSTRKDALSGLRELLEAHPQSLEPSLTPVVQSCARIVGDEDAEVRKALLQFFSWLLRLAPIDHIQPHAPLLLLFTTSAQTHIFPAIRIDAVRFLDLLLQYIPEAVVNGWNEPESSGSRVLEGYLGLLSTNSGFKAAYQDDSPLPSTSSVSLSPSSKLVVLSSLATFLRIALSPPASEPALAFPTWYMAPSFPTHDEYLSLCSLTRPTATTADRKEFEWSNREQETNREDFSGNFTLVLDTAPDPAFSLEELAAVGRTVEKLGSHQAEASRSDSKPLRIARLARTLHPILVSTWLDVAPTVFGFNTSDSEIEAQLAISVGQIAECLYGTVFRDQGLSMEVRITAHSDLTALLGYMSTYLPCASETEAQTGQFVQTLSFVYCELTSLAMIESQHADEASSAKGDGISNLKRSKVLSTQIGSVGNYLTQALDGTLKSSHPLGFSLTTTSYIKLLPTMWYMLRYQYTSGEDLLPTRICTSILNHAIRISSRSAAKATATQFVGILVLLNSYPQASPEIRLVFTPDERKLLKEWFLQLPKVLWEVGVGDLLLTETILRLLLRIAQRRILLFDATDLMSVRSRLVPYFATMHPQKGELLGPFAKLKQLALRRLALDVAYIFLRDIPSSEHDGLKLSVEKAVQDTSEAQYWGMLLDSLPSCNV